MKVIVIVTIGLSVLLLLLVLEIDIGRKNGKTETKPENTVTSWVLKVFTDLVIGIILLLIEYYMIRG